IVAHDHYNFYNPTQHPFFDQEAGRVIFFEGTYTASFSSAKQKTPRYDYNQIMYRLDLDDPRLALPVPIYMVRESNGRSRLMLRHEVETPQGWARVESASFFALPNDRRGAGIIPIYAALTDGDM